MAVASDAAAPTGFFAPMVALWRRFQLPALGFGLPTRLLLLTAAFVMMAETLIFVPTLATFRLNWLEERLTAAQLAALAAEGYPGGAVPSSIRGELLRTAQVKAVASRHNGQRRLVLPVDNDMKIDAHYDLRQSPQGFVPNLIAQFRLFGDTLGVLFAPANRTIRVLGRIGEDPDDLIEIVMPEAPLRAVMWERSLNVLGLSLLMPVVGIATALAASGVKLLASASSIGLARNTLPFAPVTATRTPPAPRLTNTPISAKREAGCLNLM